MKILVKGNKDIFYYKFTESHDFFIVNPVNTAGVMGKGLALQFKKKFPSHFEKYKDALKNNELGIGNVYIDRENRVIDFPTKRHWRSKSKKEDIREGLKDLHIKAVENNIDSIALPKLGSGLGGLDFERDVMPMIRDEFEYSELRKVVISYGMNTKANK